jgi:hypothetical protein
MKPRAMIDVNSRSVMTYTISHREIIDKVIQLTDGMPSTNPNEQAFYSTDYGKITYKRVLKICREKFSGENDSTGRGEEKERALTFDKEIIEKVGKTFEIISEIKLVERTDNVKEKDKNDTEEWEVPSPSSFPSQDCPQGERKNHAQNKDAGTEGQKFDNSEVMRKDNGEDTFLKYLAERENGLRHVADNSDLVSPENAPISVPSSPFKCYICAKNGIEFQTDNKLEYEKHGALKHVENPLLYPSKAEILQYGLNPQGKEWEV